MIETRWGGYSDKPRPKPKPDGKEIAWAAQQAFVDIYNSVTQDTSKKKVVVEIGTYLVTVKLLNQ